MFWRRLVATPGAWRAHESVLADPERRCRLLGAAPTRAGVGVVVGPERGQPNVFFTELLRANDK